jgi:hypothetical protein
VLLATQRRRFRRIFPLQLALFALVPVGELAVYIVLMARSEGRAALGDVPITKVFVHLAIAFVLGLYVRHSDRVHNTFVR